MTCDSGQGGPRDLGLRVIYTVGLDLSSCCLAAREFVLPCLHQTIGFVPKCSDQPHKPE